MDRRAAPQIDSSDLHGLSFVLLTHKHADHLDLALLRALRHQPIQWFIHPTLYPRVIGQAGLLPERVHIPKFNETITIDGLEILPFEGVHWQATDPGVPATGYLVSRGDKRWLFPGDTRTYDAQLLPNFGPIDVLFAHLWLGRACALLDEPPLLEPFCGFCLDLHPKRVIITHLEELGRLPEDYWESRHCRQVLHRLQQLAPGLPVTCASMGESVSL
jgi:hypothetical protein